PLRLAMKDGRATVKRNAAWALGELGVPEALETLRVSLKDRFESVREMAAMSICKLVEKHSSQNEKR
ncbi:HEAT repeat domain-containing protein, partial [candidate division TA06 bacterium]